MSIRGSRAHDRQDEVGQSRGQKVGNGRAMKAGILLANAGLLFAALGISLLLGEGVLDDLHIAQSGGVPRLKISHRLFAARCVAAIVD